MTPGRRREPSARGPCFLDGVRSDSTGPGGVSRGGMERNAMRFRVHTSVEHRHQGGDPPILQSNSGRAVTTVGVGAPLAIRSHSALIHPERLEQDPD
jgi:hypothetical protein